MPIQPYPARHTTENLGDTLKISIPSRKQWLIILFMAFWLAGWSLGEVTALVIVIRGLGVRGPILFILLWLTLWTFFGVFVTYTLLWQLFGKEIILISNQAIITKRAVFGFVYFPREYSAEYIKELRVLPASNQGDLFGMNRAGWLTGFSGGALAFDYGAKTIRFGMSIDEAEAKQILEEIDQILWRYRNHHNV